MHNHDGMAMTPTADGVAPRQGLGFGEALDALRAGRRVTRHGWNGRGQWVALQEPDEHSKMGRPYLLMSPVDGDLVPWVASHSDMLATDWYIAPPTEEELAQARAIDEQRRPWRGWILDHSPNSVDYEAVEQLTAALIDAGVPVPGETPTWEVTYHGVDAPEAIVADRYAPLGDDSAVFYRGERPVTNVRGYRSIKQLG